MNFFHLPSWIKSLLLLLAITPWLPGLVQLTPQKSLVDGYFFENSPLYQSFIKNQSQPNQSPPLLLALKFKESIFTTDNVNTSHQIQTDIQLIPEVTSVHSYLSAKIPKLIDGNIHFLPLSKSTDQTSQHWTNSNQTVALFHIQSLKNNSSKKFEILTLIKSTLKDRPEIEEFHLIGEKTIHQEVTSAIQRNLLWVAPLSFFIMLGVLYFITRSLWLSLIPLFISTFAILCTFGLAGYLGFVITGISMSIPQILLAMGICDSVHILVGYLSNDQKTPARLHTQNILKKNLKPTFITTITTTIAFITLVFSEVRPLYELGLLGAFGVLLTWALTYLVFSLLLPLIKTMHRSRALNISDKFTQFIVKQRHYIRLSFSLLVILGIWSATQIKTSLDYTESFSKNSAIGSSLLFFNKNFSIVSQRSYVVHCESPNCIHSPQYISDMDQIITNLKLHKSVTHVTAPSITISGLARTLQKSSPLATSSIEEAIDLLTFLGPDKTSLSPDSSQNGHQEQFQIYVDVARYSELKKIDQALVSAGQKYNLNIQATGSGYLMQELESLVIPEIWRSIAWTLIGLVFVLLLIYKNRWTVLIALIPNLVTIFSLPLLFYIFDFSITLNSLLVWCIALGVGIDDTVFFLHYFEKSKKFSPDNLIAIQNVFKNAGKSLVVTTVILISGFGTTLFTDYKPAWVSGALLCGAMAIALCADLLLLPTILLWNHKYDK